MCRTRQAITAAHAQHCSRARCYLEWRNLPTSGGDINCSEKKDGINKRSAGNNFSVEFNLHE